MSHSERRYNSDLTDQQWEVVRPLLVPQWKGPGRPLAMAVRGSARLPLTVSFCAHCVCSPWPSIGNGRKGGHWCQRCLPV